MTEITQSVTNETLSISSLIREVHHELIKSQRQREIEGDLPLFEVESLTIEAHFIVTGTTEGKGGVDLQILSVGGGISTKDEQVHKIILNLKPVSINEPKLGLAGLELATPGYRPRPIEDDSDNQQD